MHGNYRGASMTNAKSLLSTSIATRLLCFLLCLPAPGVSAQSQTPDATASPQSSPSLPPDSTQLEVIKAPQPDYPLEAAVKGIQGRVLIQLHISTTGDVTSTEILDGDRTLAEAAERAMKQWKFKPFFKDGAAVNISRKMPFDFVLHGSGCAAVEGAWKANLSHNDDGVHVPREVMEGKLTHRVEPVYPLIAKVKRIQGDVFLQAKIDKDGRIADLQALCGPPELVPTSLDAVKKWRYSPFVVNGVPVEAETTIKVQFRMQITPI